MDIDLPRTERITFDDAPMSSWPSIVTEPLTRAFDGRRPMAARNVTDLPEPDSPTTPINSLASTSRSMPRTAFRSPNGVGNVTSRFLIESTLIIRPCQAVGLWRREVRLR